MPGIKWQRSTYCAGGSCVEVAPVPLDFRGGCADRACVEVAEAGDYVIVRDATGRPGIAYTREQWREFKAAMLRHAGQGIGTARQTHLRWDSSEVAAFAKGVAAGEFDFGEGGS